MKEFKINNYIKLRLEGENTNIYINNVIFRQCKYLLIHIPINNLELIEGINSIDDSEEILDASLEEHSPSSLNITPEQEFWAHCSNLHAWAENNYDTRLLHRTIAFPLLKRLYEIGDPLASTVFKEEIVKRYETGNKLVKRFLLSERYIQKFAYREFLEYFLDNNTLKVLESISQLIRRNYWIRFDINFFEQPTFPQFSLVINNHGLNDLDLRTNSLKNFPESIFQLGSLRNLYLGTNNLKILPEDIKKLKNLEKFDLSDNFFKSIPQSISYLTSLKCLSLSLNQLGEIPDGIFHLRQLKYLNLGHNNISYIPEEICNLSSLEYLILNYNKLEEISEFLCKLKNLKILSLGHNNLTNLPTFLASIKNLKRIDIDSKFKDNIPESIKHLVRFS